ncbi:NADPH-dependent oxidoreductase [Terrihabitans sp. B22-R8]|uniref:NADPH-dependent oxidoreductase n=1 Tax=Terrihabitans sp. B22-R8 TaxID=3425128 RepID=UPI00403D1BF1
MNETITPRAFQENEAVSSLIALERRYREPLAIGAGPWNDTLASQLNHRSVRAYRPDPLPAGTLETLVAAAQSAPTSSNIQAWSVVAVDDPDIKRRLARIAGNQKHIEQAPLLLVFVADLSRVERIAGREGVAAEGLDYTESVLLAVIDATLAAQNALVAAESLGFGTVYVGALRNDPEAVAELLELPPRAFAVFGLVVGRIDTSIAADIKPRLPQDAVLHRNSYSTAAEADALARHDAHSRAFRAEQKLDPQPWTALALDRLRSASALKGRDILREVLERLGWAFR